MAKDMFYSSVSTQAVTFCVVFLVIQHISYQNVNALFSSTPSEVTPRQTSHVTLLCEPDSDNMGAILAIHLKRKEDLPPEAGEGETSEQEEGTTGMEEEEDGGTDEGEEERDYHYRRKRSSDEHFVRATMTTGNSIEIVPSLDRFVAEGDLANPAHLSVTIQNPDTSDIGLYECQVTFFDSSGNIKVASEVTQIKEAMALTLDSLELRVQKLEEEATDEEMMQNMRQEYKENHKMMEEEMKGMERENKDLVATIADLTTDIRNLQEQFATLSAQGKTSPESSESQHASPYSSDNSDYYVSSQGNRAQDEYKVRNEDIFKVNARMDELENTRIHVLEQKLDEMNDRQRDVEDRMDEMEEVVNDSVQQKIQGLETLDWQGITESLDHLETQTIPVMSQNISDIRHGIDLLQKAINFMMVHTKMDASDVAALMRQVQGVPAAVPANQMPSGPGSDTTRSEAEGSGTYMPQSPPPPPPSTPESEAPETTASSTPPATTTTTDIPEPIATTTTAPPMEAPEPTPFTGRACYMCGNNATHERCTASTAKNIGHCPDDQPNCITDVYQDGRHRHIYKRCASVKECQETVHKSFRACATDTFLNPTAMECHFCCTSVLCNDAIRPSRSLYKGT